jgi:hypothetical protein
MSNNDRFLELAVQMNRISDSTKTFVMEEQRKLRRRGDNKRVGEILVENNLIDPASREEICQEQQRRRKAQLSRFRRIIPDLPSVIGLQFLVILLAMIGVIVARSQYSVPLESATEIAGFAAFCICTAIQYIAERRAARRSLLVSAYRVGRVFLLLMIILLVFYAISSLQSLGDIITVHPDDDSRSRVALWLTRFRFAFLILVLAVCALLLYSIWKFYSQRYVEARMGALKDLIIRVESTLRDRAILPEHRQSASIEIVLKGLRNILKLSPWDRAVRKVKFYRKTTSLTTVAYLEPEPQYRGFRIVEVAFPENAPDRARDAFRYLRGNYHPASLNEETFEHYKTLAKGENPKGWKERYLNFPGRHEYISACGWIFAKRETLFSKNALKCLAFDNYFIEDLKKKGYSKEELEWVEIHSFIGCPVFASDSSTAGVLLILKNVRSGFVPEDLESAIIASQIIGRILQR